MTERRYRLEVVAPAARMLTESLPPKIGAAIFVFLTEVLVNEPRKVGKPLRPPIDLVWSARRGSYRVLYLIDEDQGIVIVTAIRHRSDAYRT
ncbi:type II toxin-antitoxin system RelE family toxin [Ferrimicrobium acidiphilum]|nr:type II toxin-antitoxin system RelE/ParE family toxin [Ferrimicrobium acidiphilum]MCL5052643.1 type II toxin-antitoxin system RelE/ParE family toxin [Gammaproteobacteria bacterium]